MSDSDSDVEKVLGKDYSFLRNTIKKDCAKTSMPLEATVPTKKDVEVSTEMVVVDTSASCSAAPDVPESKEMPNAANKRYANLSFEELNNIAERVRIFCEVGVVVPEKTVPCRNKSKKANNRKVQKSQPVAKKRKNTFGKGTVGASCSSFGVKRCLCCSVDDNNDLALARAMSEHWIPSMVTDSSAAPLSPLRETPHRTLKTSTPLSRPSNSISPEASSSSGSNPLDVSDIRVASSPNRNLQTNNEEQIMEYVNHLLGDTGRSIEAEVEERFQRLQENRLATSDAISNAITINNDEEIDFDHSVILVGESSPQPIVIDDSTIEVNDSLPNKKRRTVDLTNDSTDGAIVNKKGKIEQRNTRECPICIEELAGKDISATTCGHVFCTNCIRAAVKVSKQCPICRKKLTLNKIHPLYCLL